MHCNIDKTDRINRSIIGLILCASAMLGMGKMFYLLAGLVLMIEGLVGWCSIPWLVGKLKTIFKK